MIDYDAILLLIVFGIIGILYLGLFIYFLTDDYITRKRRKKIIEKREPCPKCGDKENRMLCIDVSNGYQYDECEVCGYKFKDTSESTVEAGYEEGPTYKMAKPEVDEQGNPIEEFDVKWSDE